MPKTRRTFIIGLMAGCAASCAARELVEIGSATAAITIEDHGIDGHDNVVELRPPEIGEVPHAWANTAFTQDDASNIVMGLGYNVGPGVHRHDPTRHAAWYAIESNYEASQDTVLTEFIWQYFSEDGTSRRPISATVDRGSLDTFVGLSGRVMMASSDGAQTLTVEENGHVWLADTSNAAYFYKVGNNTPIIAGQDSEGKAREVMRIGSDEKLYLDAAESLAGLRVHAPLEVMHETKFEKPVQLPSYVGHSPSPAGRMAWSPSGPVYSD